MIIAHTSHIGITGLCAGQAGEAFECRE